jgi:hypothetical protein
VHPILSKSRSSPIAPDSESLSFLLLVASLNSLANGDFAGGLSRLIYATSSRPPLSKLTSTSRKLLRKASL